MTSKLTITCIPGNFSLVSKFQGMSALVKITMESHSRYFFEKIYCEQLELIGAGTYCNVFSLLKDGQKLGVAMKLVAEVTKGERAVSVAGNDVAAAAYERILQKGKDMMRNTWINLPPDPSRITSHAQAIDSEALAVRGTVMIVMPVIRVSHR